MVWVVKAIAHDLVLSGILGKAYRPVRQRLAPLRSLGTRMRPNGGFDRSAGHPTHTDTPTDSRRENCLENRPIIERRRGVTGANSIGIS